MTAIAPYPGTQSIDRAAQLLVHVVETAEPPTVGELSERIHGSGHRYWLRIGH